MTTEDDFQAALAAEPKDWHTRLVFADWLQERGDKRAEGYRAMGVCRVKPAFWKSSDVWVWLNAEYAASYSKSYEMRAATLPDDWYDRLPRARGLGCAEERTTLRAALDDAARGFAKLSAKRRAELLAPPPARPKKRSPKKPAAKKTTRPKRKLAKPTRAKRRRKK